jgi:hypothetical protein
MAKRAADEHPMPVEAVQPFRELLGFTAEQWTRATNLVMLHMLVDELLTLVIVQHMDSRADDDAQERITVLVAGLFFERRVRFAVEARWISKVLARDLRETNRLRTALLHFHPRRIRRRPPPEVMSREAFVEAMNRAVNALRELALLGNPSLAKALGPR